MCTTYLAHLSTTVAGPYWGSAHLPVIIELINSTTRTNEIHPEMWRDRVAGVERRNRDPTKSNPTKPKHPGQLQHPILGIQWRTPKTYSSPPKTKKPYVSPKNRDGPKNAKQQPYTQGKRTKCGVLPYSKKSKPTSTKWKQIRRGQS